MTTLILATSNAGKIAEFQALLPLYECVSQASLGINDAEETGLSFIENAIIKARHASLFSQRPAVADDSGLVVQALGGAPGIYSARFAGIEAQDDENIELLLTRMGSVPQDQRQAYFYCAIAWVDHANDPTPCFGVGRFSGHIGFKRQGTQGFGYDSVFYVPDYGCMLAELPPEIKNTISHRAMALDHLMRMKDSL